MKLMFIPAVALMLFSVPPHAQERTAGGSVDTQMTWTALSLVAKAAADKADAVNVRVEQVVVCGKKGMVYAPEQTGADTQGCKAPVTETSTSNQITNIITCNANRQFFNGTSCVAPTVAAPTCRLNTTSHRTTGGARCPTGQTYIFQSTGPISSEKYATDYLCMSVVCS